MVLFILAEEPTQNVQEDFLEEVVTIVQDK